MSTMYKHWQINNTSWIVVTMYSRIIMIMTSDDDGDVKIIRTYPYIQYPNTQEIVRVSRSI